VNHALIVGVEFCTRYIDGTDVETAMFVGDGAGAAVLSRTPAPGGIRASAFHTDSTNFESVRMRGGGSSFPFHGRAPDRQLDLMEMHGLATWKQAITHLPGVIREACAKSGVAPGEIDFLLFHQANLRLIEYLMKKMGFGMEQTFTNVQDIGNTGSASVPIALSQAVAQGRLRAGDRIVLAAVGAGFNFAASVWDWVQCPPLP
jgi:3-oxoacyl-[acyl-carrier-protein] synthase-3